MKSRHVSSILSLLFFLYSPLSVHSWNDCGHMLVATVGYQGLSSTERSAVDSILKAHPRYASWASAHASAGSTVSLGQFIFLQASTWADDVRNYSDPSTHANWHFIDYPLRPPSFLYKKPVDGSDNAVVGIQSLVRSLDDLHLSKRIQAENLAFLIHFIGDIHQPLHCATLINSTFSDPVEGDRGGNHFRVKLKPNSANSTKLHSLWDGMVGSSSDPDTINARASVIVSEYPKSQFTTELSRKSPKDWSVEIRGHAITNVYKPLSSLDGTASKPVIVPSSYHENSRQLCTNLVALAGYRLSDTLREIIADRTDDEN